jgi:phosphate acyltransferase
MRWRIGIDLMGGDHPPDLLFPAIIEAARQFCFGGSLVILATKPVIAQLSSLLASLLSEEICSCVSFLDCEEVIVMTDHPLEAVRHKKKSSLIKGMHLLKEKEIDALVSCGNTGALIASAAIALSLLPGISHPALLAHLPTKKGQIAVLDVGGNTLCKAEQLVHFAFLGAAYQRILQVMDKPKVALLNVGVESYKGTSEVSRAYDMLKGQDGNSGMHFVGNVEGRDLFTGDVDVLVTDGFTGNVLLKTAEGAASFIFDSLHDKMKQDSTGLFERDFKDLKKRFNYAEYPGAFVCGIDAVVVKVHGNAVAESLLASIHSAINCLEEHVLAHVKDAAALHKPF